MTVLDDIRDADHIDWKAIGLKAGLEIHRQVKGGKLFCPCGSELEDAPIGMLKRELNLTRSELGEADEAAVQETKRKRTSHYQITKNTCLVEMDEEPPHVPAPSLIDAAIAVCIKMHCEPVREIVYMRKIVVDGSNTTGFQRTGLVGSRGHITTKSGFRAGITSMCLEEDAARKVEDREDGPVYRLDRLGTPEVEITTEADIGDPATAAEVARAIGEALRDTGRVKRGIGTVRQDVNVSIKGGSRTELKLVQELQVIPKAVRTEAIRQLLLIEVASTLRERLVRKRDLKFDVFDVSKAFVNTGSDLIKKELSKDGGVFALGLPGFAGSMGDRAHEKALAGTPLSVIRKEIDDVRRLGPEFASYAKVRAGVKGLFHTDELPGYGISEKEVSTVLNLLSLNGKKDGFILICGKRETAGSALKAVHERALLALDGVPSEVRRPLPDGRSEYMRPMPGAARMYPETDVPPVRIEDDAIVRVLASLPEDRATLTSKLSSSYGLSTETVNQLFNLDLVDEFLLLTEDQDPKLASSFLLQAFPRAEQAGHSPDILSTTSYCRIIGGVAEGRYSKEALPEVLVKVLLTIKNGAREDEAVASVIGSFTPAGDLIEEARRLIEDVIRDRGDLVRERKEASIGPLMGIVMKKLRGKVDGKTLSELLKAGVERFLGGQ